MSIVASERPTASRRWSQFSLRLLLLIVVGANVFCWAYHIHMRSLAAERSLVKQLEKRLRKAEAETKKRFRTQAEWFKKEIKVSETAHFIYVHRFANAECERVILKAKNAKLRAELAALKLEFRNP